MKCINCKNCIGFENGYYICNIKGLEMDYVEECIANDENIGCEGYVDYLDDDD